ncbi:MAG: hypothetical protein RLZZ214_2191 [Verrucomicrobiota bacterium]|jgi:hypothetical protein
MGLMPVGAVVTTHMAPLDWVAIDLRLRDVKTTLQMERLQVKPPETAHKRPV